MFSYLRMQIVALVLPPNFSQMFRETGNIKDREIPNACLWPQMKNKVGAKGRTAFKEMMDIKQAEHFAF